MDEGVNGLSSHSHIRSIVEDLSQEHFALCQRFHTMLDVSFPDNPVGQTLVLELLTVAHAARMGSKRDAKHVIDRMHNHCVAILRGM